MEEKNGGEKVDELMLPGFRFHPTDEELVGFYLKRKIKQRPLSIELIKQLDIYKYDPWDLPKLATTGEKEWYFYCPRDRKYRNSARPNRVTGAGFWKATGTDRPIYSSEGNKCIGLKKSLVFYKGRASKGIKTDWMMHEFRLPSLSDSVPPKRCMDKTIPANDSWAICRIFKKTSTITQRTLSHSWVSPSLPNPRTSRTFNPSHHDNAHFSLNDIQSAAKLNKQAIQVNNNHNNNNEEMIQSSTNFSLADIQTFKPIYPSILDIPTSYMLPQLEEIDPVKCNNIDLSAVLLNMSSSVLGEFSKQTNTSSMDPFDLIHNELYNGFSRTLSQGTQTYDFDGSQNLPQIDYSLESDTHCTGLLPLAAMSEAWKPSPSSLLWDCLPCPGELPTNYPPNQCYS